MVRLGVSDQRSGEDRRSNDSDAPWWVTLTLKVGVPAAIAMFLVYLLAVDVRGANARIERTLADHITIGPAMIRMLEDHERSDIRLETYARLNCVHAAKTQAERDACLSVR